MPRLPPTAVGAAPTPATARNRGVDEDDGALVVGQDGLALSPLLALGLAEGAAVEAALVVEVRAEVGALAAEPLADHRLALSGAQAERGVAGVGLGVALGGPLAQAGGGFGGQQGRAPRQGVGAELADAGRQLVGREVAGAVLVGERLGPRARLLADGAERRALVVGEGRALGAVAAIGAVAPSSTVATGAARATAVTIPALRADAVAAASGVGLKLGGLLVGEHVGDGGGGGPQVGTVGVGVPGGDGVEGGLLAGVEREALRETVEAGVEGGGGGLGVGGDGHGQAEEEGKARVTGEAGEMRQGSGGKE